MKSKIFSFFMIIICLFNFTSCYEIDSNDVVQLVEFRNDNKFGKPSNNCISNIDFDFKDEYVLFDESKVLKNELLSYESPYSDISSFYFKNQLNAEQQVLYNSFIYAYENKFTKINYFTDIVDIQPDLDIAIQSLCADNPFFDWNYNYTLNYDFINDSFEINLSHLINNDFDFKVKAYDKAKSIVSNIPNNLSDYETIKYIYDLVSKNVTYVENLDYYTSNNPHYIYDALFEGETQCSGFADTVTMLCNLVDINTITIIGDTLTSHAWNLIELEGEYYHCDPTNDSSLKGSLEYNYDINIAFLKSDNYIYNNGYSPSEIIKLKFPNANNTKYDNLNIDLFLEKLASDSSIKIIGDTLIDKGTFVFINSEDIANTDIYNDILVPLVSYVSKNIKISYTTEIYISYLVFPENNSLIFFLDLK